MDKISSLRIFLLTVYSFLAGLIFASFYPLLPAYRPVFWPVVSLLFLTIITLFYKRIFLRKTTFCPSYCKKTILRS